MPESTQKIVAQAQCIQEKIVASKWILAGAGKYSILSRHPPAAWNI
jgi:hypothetical protein